MLRPEDSSRGGQPGRQPLAGAHSRLRQLREHYAKLQFNNRILAGLIGGIAGAAIAGLPLLFGVSALESRQEERQAEQRAVIERGIQDTIRSELPEHHKNQTKSELQFKLLRLDRKLMDFQQYGIWAGLVLVPLIFAWRYRLSITRIRIEQHTAYAHSLGVIATSEVALHVVDDELFRRIKASRQIKLPVNLAKRKELDFDSRVKFAADNLELLFTAAGRFIRQAESPELFDVNMGFLSPESSALALIDFLLSQTDSRQLEGWTYPLDFPWQQQRGWQMPSAEFLAELQVMSKISNP